jgi:hypothetical protein
MTARRAAPSVRAILSAEDGLRPPRPDPAATFKIRPFDDRDRESVVALASEPTVGIAAWRPASGVSTPGTRGRSTP